MARPRPVVCTACNRTIYDYVGPASPVLFRAEHFRARPPFPAPGPTTALECPNCGERWVSVSAQSDSIRMMMSPHTRGSGTVKF